MKNSETLERGTFNEIRTLLYEEAGEPGEHYWRLLMEALEAAFERGAATGRDCRPATLEARQRPPLAVLALTVPKGYPADGLPRKRPRACAICKHPERQRIELLRASGMSLDKLAERFGVTRDAVWRHWQTHVPEERKATYLCGPSKVAELSEIAAEESGNVLDHLRVLRSILMQALSNSAAAGNYGQIATLASPLLKTLRQLGGITGEISQIASSITINQSSTTILMSPAFLALQEGLISICTRHPEARAEILALLADLDRQYGEPAPLIEARPAIVCEAIPAEAAE